MYNLKNKVTSDVIKLTLFSLLATTAAISLAASDTLDNSVPQARVRIFGQNGKPTEIRYTFNGHKVKKTTGGTIGGAFASMIGAARNSSIGIPATETLNIMRQHNHNLSKLYYQEFAIPADVPITVSNAIIGLTNVNNTHGNGKIVNYQSSCNGDKLIFVPQAGKDYEVIASSTSAQCGVTIQEVNSDGSIKPIMAN